MREGSQGWGSKTMNIIMSASISVYIHVLSTGLVRPQRREGVHVLWERGVEVMSE